MLKVIEHFRSIQLFMEYLVTVLNIINWEVRTGMLFKRLEKVAKAELASKDIIT